MELSLLNQPNFTTGQYSRENLSPFRAIDWMLSKITRAQFSVGYSARSVTSRTILELAAASQWLNRVLRACSWSFQSRQLQHSTDFVWLNRKRSLRTTNIANFLPEHGTLQNRILFWKIPWTLTQLTSLLCLLKIQSLFMIFHWHFLFASSNTPSISGDNSLAFCDISRSSSEFFESYGIHPSLFSFTNCASS